MNSLNFVNEDWPLVERSSRSPHATLWRDLFRYAGKDLSERLFLRPAADPDFHKSFTNALTLADDMIAAWENVDDPFAGLVLLYYGALWLGNAVALCSLNGSVLRRRRATHGLGVSIAPEEPRPFLNGKIDFGSDEESFGTINLAMGGGSLAGRTPSVADLLQALPEMGSSLKHLGLQCAAIELTARDSRQDESDVLVVSPAMLAGVVTDDTISEGWLRDHLAVFDGLRERGLTVAAGYDGRHIVWHRLRDPSDSRWLPDSAELRAVAIPFARRHYLLPKIKRVAVSEYAIYLAILYSLGHLARYYPDYWINMQRDRTEEFFLIEDFLDIAEDKVPNLILNHLSRHTNVYRSS